MPGERRFVIVNKITIVSILVLILAGGVVRSTGSGMGCPDWPKCFNQYIPPTDVSQLPEGYEQQYIESRKKKNDRFAGLLDMLGLSQLSEAIKQDKSILTHEEFNAAKTWTEYINRLIGAITGIFMLLCAIFSFAFIKSRKRIFFFSILNLFVVFFQAWLGSIVVSTNLLPWVITIHMLLALVILAISIYTYFQAKVLRDSLLLINRSSRAFKVLALILVWLTVLQVAIGTDVREQIDSISIQMQGEGRSTWISKLGPSFTYHRDIAVGVFVLNIALFFLVRARYARKSEQSVMANAILTLIVLQLATGFVLAELGIPPYAQTAHLVLASLLFGAQFYLMLLLGKTSEYVGQ